MSHSHQKPGHTSCGHEHAHGDHCCGHDHSHGGDNPCEGHSHGKETCSHGHAHDHDHGCCGHQHDTKSCGHDHHHHEGCCGHDHSHDEPVDAEWTRRFFLTLQAVVLIMIGGLMCYFVASGRIDGRNPSSPYVVGGFKVLVLTGGLGIMLMGIFNWLMRHRSAGCTHSHEGDCCGTTGDDSHNHAGHDHADDDHTHHHEGSVAARAFTLLILSGSLGTAAVLTPDEFSSKYLLSKADAYRSNAGSAEAFAKANPALAAAAAQEGFTLAKVEEYVKRTKDGNFPLSVVNLHYMSSDPEYARVMEGQPVETTGQVVKDTLNPGPGHLRVFTLQVTCCAADARPYSIPVIFEPGSVPDFVEMGWYIVTGKLEFTTERGIKMARLRATGLQATIRPADLRPDF